MKNKDTSTSFKNADNKYERIDVVEKRVRTKRTDPRVLPTGVTGLVADAPKVRMDEKTAIQSEIKDIFETDKEKNSLESYIFRMRDKPATRGGYGMSTSSANSGRSPDRWRRLDLLRSGDVQPKPGPPPARSRGGELLTADITAGTATTSTISTCSLLFETVVRVVLSLRLGSSSSLRLQQGTWNGVRSGELSSGAAGSLVAALRRLVLLAVSLGASVPDSTLHFRALWRLHKSWLLAVPPEFTTPVDFKLALASPSQVKLNSVYPSWACFTSCSGLEWREITWNDVHIFDRSQAARYPNVFGVLGVRAPKTRRQQVHAKVQHVLVECPGLAQLLKALQLRLQVSSAVSLDSGSCAHHAARFRAVLRRHDLVDSPFTLAGFGGGGATDHFLHCRDVPPQTREVVLRGRTAWKASPFLLTQQNWWLSFPTWRHKSSTKLPRFCLPASHPNTVDQRLERVVEVRV